MEKQDFSIIKSRNVYSNNKSLLDFSTMVIIYLKKNFFKKKIYIYIYIRNRDKRKIKILIYLFKMVFNENLKK